MQLHLTSMRSAALAAVVLALLPGGAAQAAGNPALRRNLSAYFIFAERHVQLKNLDLEGSCNIGVNCKNPAPSNECGKASLDNPFMGDGSQLASDLSSFQKPGGSVFQLFRNGGGPLSNVTIRLPGMQPDGTDLLNPLPILADIDGDGRPSCGANCTPDVGDLEAACGFDSPFPACNPAKPIVVLANSDCPASVGDVQPGNSTCDLAPGTYGDLVVQNGGKLNLKGGTYNICAMNIGKNTVTTAAAPAVVNIPSPGTVQVNNSSTFGQPEKCGNIAVHVKGGGGVALGRESTIAGFFCAPESLIFIGHRNDLTGQFVGDQVAADINDIGHCCGGGSCTCFDAFSPASAHVGGTITFTSGCDLTVATGIKICGIDAQIITKSVSQLTAKVPVGASGACPVKAESAAGTFTSIGILTVN